MKRFARTVAFAGLLAALLGAAPVLASAASAASPAPVTAVASDGDTSWGGCDLPLCKPLS
ncbi:MULTISPECIES: hypothetical protein [Kitasatospora]|uniref:hypothetical protein n=1 Tax=Kitasatospora TaxID=2063 RepID=UPI0004C44F81|nr:MULTISPECIES: hypothetical protein [unclassified Kitasatospora]WAL73550.1 hypothetical protein OU787_19765 [Kitasatospora sp. YST-16]WNW39606.1 hypothetical protein RKE32_19710 [Streptomyces sp. Li-HN-5-13]